MRINYELVILDRVRSLAAHDLSTGEMLFRLTSLEEPSLNCTAEGEEVTDAVGAIITTLYRSKRATFSATNSMISIDLAAAQYGTKKEVAGLTEGVATITDYAYDIITIGEDGTAKLENLPEGATLDVDSIQYIYAVLNGEAGASYKVGAAVSDTEFTVAEDGTITVPTGLTGKIYVEYQYENSEAMRVVNRASEFPEACSVVIYAYFRDVCNENIVYSGKIICPKAKLNPESIELALTSTGKHAFELTMMKDYCEEENDQLFTIVISK